MAGELLSRGAVFLLSDECYDNYFLDHNFMDVPCFKAVLSKGLGLAIIAGSLMVKVPQILKMMANKSGEGINIFSVLFDLMAITFHLSYSFRSDFPFSAWGDSTFLALQTAAIAALVFYYGGFKAKALAFCVAYSLFLYVFNSPLTPMTVVATAQSCNIPILLIAKMSQAMTNFKNGSTGQLSAVTVVLLFAGSVARIFTSIQETGDRQLIIMFCVSSFANGIILAQLIYYWNKSTGKNRKKEKPIVPKKPPKKVN